MQVKLGALITFTMAFAQPCSAQLARNSQEVWPSIDAYYRINQKWRLYGTVAGTKMDESSYADGAVGIFADYFIFPPPIVQKWSHHRNDSLPGKFFWMRFGYQYSATPPSSEDPFKESMLVAETNSRFYLPLKMLLTVKNRFDGRVQNDEFNVRYRPRLNVERDLKTEYLNFTAYGFGEYFVNFGNQQVDKFRTQLGVEIRVTRHVNYEVFWNHQFANGSEVQEVNAFGMTIKVYLHRNDFKKKPAKTQVTSQ